MKTPQTCWMIQTPSGYFVYTTASGTRRRCIENFVSAYTNWSWKSAYRDGQRAVRVNLIPSK